MPRYEEEFRSDSAHETFELGRVIGQELEAGALVAFFGGLGAGKTCCIQGLAAGLAVPDLTLVTSPTFTLIQEYQGRLPIYHFDCYRLEGPTDLADLGYEEYFYGDGVTVIEWAERITAYLPSDYLAIAIQLAPDQTRRLALRAVGEQSQRLLQRVVARVAPERCASGG